MIEDEVIHAQQGLMVKLVLAFPDAFLSIVKITNLVKAKQWYDSQDQLFPEKEDIVKTQLSKVFHISTRCQEKQFRSKGAQGRGPKRLQ